MVLATMELLSFSSLVSLHEHSPLFIQLAIETKCFYDFYFSKNGNITSRCCL